MKGLNTTVSVYPVLSCDTLQRQRGFIISLVAFFAARPAVTDSRFAELIVLLPFFYAAQLCVVKKYALTLCALRLAFIFCFVYLTQYLY